ncbi:hypothetical protein JV175_00695 [Mycoplasma gypis]|nr:hypothetical protein [[Mycoplasma] gypis]
MLSVSLQSFDALHKDKLTFEEIFNYVRDRFDEDWKNSKPEDYDLDLLYQNKRGELYKLLTIDGGFFRLADGRWTNNRPTEISNN